MKPNAEELAEVTGRFLRTFGDVADSAQVLHARGSAPCWSAWVATVG